MSHSKVVREARINDIASGNDGKGPAGGDQQSDPLLKVNDVKAGDRKVTGSVFVLPRRMKTVQVTFLPTFRSLTQDLQFNQSSAESGDASMGRFVPFEFDVPSDIELKEGNMLFLNQRDNPRPPNAGNVKNIVVIVKPADKGNGQAPGGGAGDTPPKPPAPGGGAGEKPGKPHAPGGGAGDNPRTGGGSSSFGSSSA
ncbi:hypothetical protein NAL12_07465 [Corynebacterium belfantii]|uniref:hypothetical protein n=1 Tax=Corynebacterium belfantii TaxID=2014537 RepID=UPI0039776CB5